MFIFILKQCLFPFLSSSFSLSLRFPLFFPPFFSFPSLFPSLSRLSFLFFLCFPFLSLFFSFPLFSPFPIFSIGGGGSLPPATPPPLGYPLMGDLLKMEDGIESIHLRSPNSVKTRPVLSSKFPLRYVSLRDFRVL